LITLVDDRIPGTSPTLSGVLFALPHRCSLVTAPWTPPSTSARYGCCRARS